MTVISYSGPENRVVVIVAAPGERWEIEFFGDGSVEIEKFISTGEITGAESLGELFVRYEDQDKIANAPKEDSGISRIGKVP